MNELQNQAPFLIVAALERELAPLVHKRLEDVEFLVTGEGRSNAECALRSRLAEGAIEAVICCGFAGALSPQLCIGDLIIDKSRWRDADTVAATASLTVYPGTIVTVDEIVGAAAKRDLAANFARSEIACVDMESAAIIAVCDEHKIPLLLIRAISDLCDEDLPIDFNACRDQSGRVKNAKVLRAVARRPQAIKGLLELNRRAKIGAANLANFIERLLAGEKKAAAQGG